MCDDVVAGKAFQPLLGMSPLLEPALSKTLTELTGWVNEFSDGPSLCDHLEPAYVRLFVSARKGIAAPLYQSCYAHDHAPMMGPAAVRMKERLDAAGLSLGEEIREPPDHLSIQLEYLYFLLEKGFHKSDPSCTAQAASFSREIMLPWVREFHERLAAETQCPFYPLAASLLVSLLTFIATGRIKRRPST
jgi:TorA-specific chaperone